MTETELLAGIYSKFNFGPVLSNVNGKMQVTQWFGQNNLAYYRQAGMLGHDALDMVANTGTISVAPIDGIVTEVVHNPLQNTREGEYIHIESAEFRLDGRVWKLQILWYHIDKSLVALGQKVKKGEPVVRTDNTGAITTGPHLHFAVRPWVKTSDNVWVMAFPNNGYHGHIDPYPFFNKRDFFNDMPGEHRIRPRMLIKSGQSPRVYFVNEALELVWIENEETFIRGRDMKWWGDWKDIMEVRTKLIADSIINIKGNL